MFFGGGVCLSRGGIETDAGQDVVEETGQETGQDTDVAEEADGVSVMFEEAPFTREKASSALFSYRCLGEDGVPKNCTYECMVEAVFSEPEGTAAASDDLWKWGSCGKSHTVETLWAGDYKLRVRATDKKGETAEGSSEWQKTYVEWKSVSAGSSQTCAIDTDSRLWCWGSNGYGLGVAGVKASRAPVLVGPDKLWKTVTVGMSHACAITSEGRLSCWGGNSAHESGIQGAAQYAVPTDVVMSGGDSQRRDSWVSISAGARHTCGIYGAALYCWGTGAMGQLGITNQIAEMPTRVTLPDSNELWSGVSVGEEHSCVVAQESGFWCWGSNQYGQIGDELKGKTHIPRQIERFNHDAVGGISAGALHTCAVSEYDVYCWGTNMQGQLGVSPIKQSSSMPVLVAIEEGSVQVSSGLTHACVVKASKELWCWGKGVDGESTADSAILMPTRMDASGSSDWEAISAGSSHTCGIRNKDELWCWGANSSLQLGLDREDTLPVKVPSKLRVHFD